MELVCFREEPGCEHEKKDRCTKNGPCEHAEDINPKDPNKAAIVRPRYRNRKTGGACDECSEYCAECRDFEIQETTIDS
jgi:hypothetical protein